MSGVPSDILVPFMGIDFDASKAVPTSTDLPVKVLMLGQMESTGTKYSAIAPVKDIPSSAEEVSLAFGKNSMLRFMAEKSYKNYPNMDLTVIAAPDESTGTKATHVFSITGTALAAGSLAFNPGKRRYVFPIAIGDEGEDIVAAILAALTADAAKLPFVATAATTTMTLTMFHKGLSAGDLDVRFNKNPGERTPAGLTISAVTTTPGTVDPDVADLLALVGSDWYDIIINPYADTDNMDTIEDFLLEQSGPLIQNGGICYQAMRDTRSNLITFATNSARNSQFMALLPAYKRQLSTWELAAAVGAAVGKSVADDCAVPLHRIPLIDVDTLHPDDKWTLSERNQLAKNGVCTFSDNVGCSLEAMFTMYLKNSSGAPDISYRKQNTIFQLLIMRYSFRNQILTKYSRAKLARSAEKLEPGQQVITPDIGKAEAIIWFDSMQKKGICDSSQEAADLFAENVQCSIDTDNPDRLNWLLPPELMKQFMVGSGVMQFRL